MNTKHFTHLHLHTEYSLLDGAIRISDLIPFAQKQQWKAVGISDHGNIFGAVEFFQTAHKAGIKPILGCEMYFTPDVTIKDVKEKYFHLILIVQNKVGYKNLCRLMSLSYQQGFYFKPRIDYAWLEKYHEGLIVSTACVGGHIPTLLREGNDIQARERIQWFLDRFGRDRFFLEVMPPDFDKQIIANDKIFALAEELNIKTIATGDAHYLHKEDHEAHEVLLAVQTHDVMTNPNRYSFGEFDGHLRTTENMLSVFAQHEQSVWNTGLIADSCEFDFEKGKLYFPNYPLPPEHTQESYFKELSEQGLKSVIDQELVPQDQIELYNARLSSEIELITTMGFVTYFLVVSDFIRWAKEQHIPVGPGRGSVAGSLVAWALGITNVDPLKYNLLFERFLNPERVSMPDIDIDFCIERREEVINYVKNKYGQECVCQIITFGTMMAKGAIKDVARALGFPFKDANAITDLIPDQLKITLKEAIEQEPALANMIHTNPQVKKLVDISLKLEGITRHASKHAAGIVISPEPLQDMLPLYIPPKTTDLVAQYAMTELESIGFLKMDFLGLKNLTLIERSCKSIARNHGITINLDHLPLDDAKTFQLLQEGKTDGVFQFESEGIKEVLRKLKPDRFEDLIAVNALYRPGPLGSGMVDDYIERRHGRTKTTYTFAQLEPVLSETYGVIVYQEQVMKIASEIAGYTLGGADILRRAMGKKKADEMAQQKDLFVTGAISRGFDKKKAEALFDLMAYFAGYGFNKSHSTAYALIAYQTAYLKANYPLEFMAALITFETSSPDKLTQYLQEVSEMGIKTYLPDINLSDIEFRAHNDGILFGLQGIKNVGLAALETIIAEREKKPFLDLLDFCNRVDLRTVNKRVIENLIATGAFDGLPGNRAQKTNELEKIIARALEEKEAAKTGQMNLFSAQKSSDTDTVVNLYQFEPCSDWSDKEKLEKEKELAGFYLSSHPLKTYESILKHCVYRSFTDALLQIKTMTSIQEPVVICCGLLMTNKVITTKKGDKMAFVQCEDLSGTAEIVIFPKLYATVSSWLSTYQVFMISGSLDVTSPNKCKIKAQTMVPVELLFEVKGTIRAAEFHLPTSIDQTFLESIQTKLSRGTTPLYFIFEDQNRRLRLQASSNIKLSLEMLSVMASVGINVQLQLT